MGFVLLKKYFQSCMVLVGRGRLLCQRSCVSLMGGSIGTSDSVALCRTWEEEALDLCWVCFIPKTYGALVLIRFVGNQQ